MRGISIDIASNDSASTSFIYPHLSNAFIQSGFVEEAEKYINKSLEYDPSNLYSAYVKPYVLYAKSKDLEKLKEGLIQALSKDTMRFDIIQEIGKTCYYMRDYESTAYYYKRFTDIRKAMKLDVCRFENAKIGLVFAKVGMKEESELLFKDYLDYAENDQSIYKDLSLAVYYSYVGDKAKSITYLKLFSRQQNFHYWTTVFLTTDPLIDNIKELPEFRKIYQEIDASFKDIHNRIERSLKDKGVI